jgi:hypothetical protein
MEDRWRVWRTLFVGVCRCDVGCVVMLSRISHGCCLAYCPIGDIIDSVQIVLKSILMAGLRIITIRWWSPGCILRPERGS